MSHLFLYTLVKEMTGMEYIKGRYKNFIYLIISKTECIIIQYVGDDEVVEIPYKINDLEVLSFSLAFYGNETLRRIFVAEGFKGIDKGAFVGCRNLEEVILPNSLKYIEAYAFLEATIKKIVIPCNVEFIAPYAFVNCSNLAEVNFINSFFEYKRMYHHSFKNCNSLKSLIYSGDLNFDELAMVSDIERRRKNVI